MRDLADALPVMVGNRNVLVTFRTEGRPVVMSRTDDALLGGKHTTVDVYAAFVSELEAFDTGAVLLRVYAVIAEHEKPWLYTTQLLMSPDTIRCIEIGADPQSDLIHKGCRAL